MYSAIASFAHNLENLREFVELLAPVLNGRQEDQLEQDAKDLAPLLLAMAELNPNLDNKGGELLAGLRSMIGENVKIERTKESPDRVSIEVLGHLKRPFDDAMTRLAKSHGQTTLLYRSALISLVSAAEWYLSQLLHVYFDRFPDAVGSGEKTFSLNDLKGFGSIDEAANFLIDHRVEDILRGSFEDWVRFLRSGPKLSMTYLGDTEEDLAEVFQRRNVVIHNGGIANRQYCARVSEKHRASVRLETPINVDREYLDSAISLFERNFLLIGAEFWKKLWPTEVARGDLLTELAFGHMKAERWPIAESLSYFTSKDARLPERQTLCGKINYWQTLKWQGRLDEVKADVINEDISAKENIYRLAKHALLDEENLFLDLLERMLDEKSIPIEYLQSWPIFRNMRELPRVSELIARHEKPRSKNEAITAGE